MRYRYKETRSSVVMKSNIAREPIDDKYGIYSSQIGKKPCTVRIHGQQCWGMEVSGTGCTNPDCPRNNEFGGY